MTARKAVTVGQLIKQLKMNPTDMPVMYASDEEGNSFHPILCLPSQLPLEEIRPLIPHYEIECVRGHKEVLVIN